MRLNRTTNSKCQTFKLSVENQSLLQPTRNFAVSTALELETASILALLSLVEPEKSKMIHCRL